MATPSLGLAPAEERLAAARAELEQRVRAGGFAGVEGLSDAFPEVWADPEAALELAYSEYVFRAANGESPRRHDWYDRFPQWRDRLDRLFGLYDLMAGAGTHDARGDATIGPAADGPPADGADEPPGYELLGELGRGGMAVVYKARQVDLDRPVALKMLRGGGWFRGEDTERIRREAQAAARLQHPNIVQIHEVGTWDGMPFLSMEYVPGGTLADALTRARRPGGPAITPVQSAELVETLARAMQYAHDRGIVHRDLKPANILLTADGLLANPKIADFGLALTHDLSPSVTQTATLAGTPSFMAPEQADARKSEIGPRTDVYALGGILYELLAGRPPFQGATVLETLDLVRGTEPVPPRLLRTQLPRDLETICLKCLQKDPARRYDSAAALADDLERFRAGRPIVARPVGPWERGWKWCRRRPVMAGVLVVLFAAVAAAVVLPSVYWQRAEDARAAEADLRHQAEEREAKLLLKTARLQWVSNDLDGARESLTACDAAHRDDEWAYLWRACRPPLLDVRFGEEMPVSPSGDLRFSADGDGLLVTHSPNPRKLRVLVLDPVSRSARSISAEARPPGTEFVYPRWFEVLEADGVGASGVTRIIRTDLRTGEQRVLWQSAGRTNRARFSPDGRFAIVRAGPVLTVVDLATGKERRVSETAGETRLAITPGGGLVGALDLGRQVTVLDGLTGKEAYRITCPARPFRIHSLAINTDCSRAVFSAGVDGRSLEFIVCSRGGAIPDVSIPTGLTNVAEAHFSPDGRLLAAWGGESRFVRVWDSFTGQEVTTLRGHRDRIERIAFSPDSRSLAIVCAGWRVAVWDVRPE